MVAASVPAHAYEVVRVHQLEVMADERLRQPGRILQLPNAVFLIGKQQCGGQPALVGERFQLGRLMPRACCGKCRFERRGHG